MPCAMIGVEIQDSGDSIWDHGEWISRAWVNSQIDVYVVTFDPRAR